MGNPHEMTILQLAQAIKKMSGSSNEIVYQDLPEDDPKVRRPDISRAQEVLEWQPQVSFEDGIERTLAYFKKVV